MRPLATAALALVLLAAIVPLAAADHAYSHRYIVYGRVVDAVGFPVQGVTVQVATQNLDNEGQCSANHPPVSQLTTTATGDFFWCQHTHRITVPTTATWSAKAGNKTVTGTVDPNIRKSPAYIQLAETVPVSTRGDSAKMNTTYQVWVTLWEPGHTAVEGITVEGTALTARKVTGTVTYNGGKTATAEGTSNDYGDALLTFNLAEPLQSGTVTVNGPKDQSASANLDTTFHASTLHLIYPGDPWYTDTGLLSFAIIGGLAVAGGVAWGITRMMKSRESASLGRRARR